MSDEGFTIQFENGSSIEVSLEERSSARLRGMNETFLWVPGPHYSELGKEGAVWALRQGQLNAIALVARLVPIPRKYDISRWESSEDEETG